MSNKLETMLQNNETGAESLLDNLIRLLAEGYEISFRPCTFAVAGEDRKIPGVTVSILDGNGEVSCSTGAVLFEAMARAYAGTPKTEPKPQPQSNESIQCGNCDTWRAVINGVIQACEYCGDDEIDLALLWKSRRME